MSHKILSRLLTEPEAFARDYQRRPPNFLYNDQRVCCLLDQTTKSPTCPGINHGYLGKRGKDGVPFLVNIDGEDLVLKTTNPGQLSLVYRKEPPTNIKSFNATLKKAPSRCGYSNIDDLRYLGADEFTNEMIIGIILSSYFITWNEETKNNFYPIIEYLTSTVCQDRSPGLKIITATPPIGVHLMEYADLGTLVDFANRRETQVYRQRQRIIDPRSPYGEEITIEVIKPDIILQIIRQVIAALHLLQNEFDFNHGDLKAANILVRSEPAKGIYQGVDISAPFTCKVADYGKSSLTFGTDQGPHRIYNRTWLADRYLYIMPFTPMINTQRTREGDEPFFIVQGLFNIHLYTRTRHMGLPFYLAFDTYTFLISILLIPAFYYSFFESPHLVEKVWTPLWFGQDGQRMQQDILVFHKDPSKAQSISTVLNLLKGIRLRCNATQILLNNLRG
jgi:hypothetical protein